MWRHERQVLSAFFAFGWRRAAGERATTAGRIFLLAVVLFIFWAMWNATPLGELGAAQLTVAQLFWYLAATETVAMSVGFPYRDVEADIYSGEMAISLVKPVHYAWAALANWIGETTYRFLLVSAAALLCCLFATRQLPFEPLVGVWMAIGLWLGCVMVVLCQLGIGLLATWMKSAAPAFWIWQKLFFVLGGLMIPLSLYPAWLLTLAKATPFAAMLFLPASLVFDSSAAHVASIFVAQVFWICVLSLLLWFTHARVESHLLKYGA